MADADHDRDHNRDHAPDPDQDPDQANDHHHDATQFLGALRRYAQDPLATAERMLAAERTEVTAERDAFETFAERLATIDPVKKCTGPGTTRPMGTRDSPDDRLERVRTAFRETVMSVPHYDDVYGESLVEHVGAECGDDLAAGLRPETSVSFTPTYKRSFRTATAQAADERRVFLDTLDREATSIGTARSELSGLLGQLDSTTVPEWYCERFVARLDAVAHDRQETIRTRHTGPLLEAHAFCECLYQDAPWTYPVLTAVARVREAMTL